MPPTVTNPIPKPATLPETGFVRVPQILAVFPVGRSTWWQGVAQGRYPAAVKLGPRTTAWRVEDIRALLATVASRGVVASVLAIVLTGFSPTLGMMPGDIGHGSKLVSTTSPATGELRRAS